MSVWGFQMVLVCQKVVSQLRNSLRNGALVEKIGSFYALAFRSCEMALVCQKLVSQLRNTLRNRALAANLFFLDFVAAKCEFVFFGFRSCEMRFIVLRNGTRVPKMVSQLRKFSQRGAWGCEMVSQQNGYSAAKWRFCNELVGTAKWFRSKVPILQRLRNLADPCFSPVFYPFSLRFCSERLPSISLQFLLILIIQKPILHQKKTRIKALKSKLKH